LTRELEAGSTAVAGQAVLRLVEADSFWLRVRIDQGRSAGLAVGQPAAIVLRSRPGESLAGKVARIEQLSDAVTEERIAMVAFDALPAGLTLNEMAEVTVQLPPRADVLSVPPAALVRQDGRTGVFVVDDGRARFRPIRVGVRAETAIEVLDGLKGGESVIVRRIRPLADGDRVRVTAGNGGDSK
jgi:HlyD family secretion protein